MYKIENKLVRGGDTPPEPIPSAAPMSITFLRACYEKTDVHNLLQLFSTWGGTHVRYILAWEQLDEYFISKSLFRIHLGSERTKASYMEIWK